MWLSKAISMRQASEREATAAMNSFISAFWHESMEDARRKKKMEAQGNDKA